MVKIYHYTNFDGKLAIERSGYLKMSRLKVGDALYGDGVYLTSMGPREATEHLIMNNWGTNPGENSIKNKDYFIPAMVANTEWYFEFESSLLSSAEMHIYPQEFPELNIIFLRDIWIYPNRDLNLGGIQGKRRKATGYGIRVENGILGNLTNAEVLAKKLYLDKPQRFIKKIDFEETHPPPSGPEESSRAVLRMSNGVVLNGMTARIPMSAFKNAKPKKLNAQKAATNENNSTNATTGNTMQDGGVGTKNNLKITNSSDNGGSKTSVVFHSFHAAEAQDTKVDVKKKKLWGRFKKLFRLSNSKKTNEDETDASGDMEPVKVVGKLRKCKQYDRRRVAHAVANQTVDYKNYEGEEEDYDLNEDSDEDLCFVCFINLFCL